MSILNCILGIVGFIGVVGTFYFGVKSNALRRSKNRYSWADVHEGCRQLGRYVSRRIKPDVIACFSGPSGIVANLVVESTNYFVPVYSIILEKDGKTRVPADLPGWRSVKTTRWRLHIPENLLKAAPRRVCLINDVVVSGDSLHAVKSILVEAGFKEQDISCCSLICSTIAQMARKCPDKYVYLTHDTSFYLPWGPGY